MTTPVSFTKQHRPLPEQAGSTPKAKKTASWKDHSWQDDPASFGDERTPAVPPDVLVAKGGQSRSDSYRRQRDALMKQKARLEQYEPWQQGLLSILPLWVEQVERQKAASAARQSAKDKRDLAALRLKRGSVPAEDTLQRGRTIVARLLKSYGVSPADGRSVQKILPRGRPKTADSILMAAAVRSHQTFGATLPSDRRLHRGPIDAQLGAYVSQRSRLVDENLTRSSNIKRWTQRLRQAAARMPVHKPDPLMKCCPVCGVQEFNILTEQCPYCAETGR